MSHYRNNPSSSNPPVKPGDYNRLKVVRQVEFGVYLDGGDMDSILLPKKFVPEGTGIGDQLRVFIYLDADGIPIATTQRPRIRAGQCAYLQCVATSKVGAFMDWGLSKDLLVPFSEQNKPMERGRSYAVYAYVDNASNRVAGSARLSKYLSETASAAMKPGQKVTLFICSRTGLGYKAVIDGTHLGLIFKAEAFQPLTIGGKVDGYIKGIRPDGKIDLSLQRHNQAGRDELSQQILDYLESRGGVSHLTDKARPEAIYQQFKVSKKSYKKALGGLYRQKLILIEPDQITLL